LNDSESASIEELKEQSGNILSSLKGLLNSQEVCDEFM
jgi:hypothetical protein